MGPLSAFALDFPLSKDKQRSSISPLQADALFNRAMGADNYWQNRELSDSLQL